MSQPNRPHQTPSLLPPSGAASAMQSFPAYNLLRWSMALLVVVSHARDLIFRDASQVAGLGLGWKLFYFVTGLGHEAVVVFFVLSGFFVGGKIVASKDISSADIYKYLIDRFSRIYIVLVPALLLTAVLDRCGAALAPIYSATGWSMSLKYPVVDLLTLDNFFGSLLNLTMYVGQPLGSNSPLWSLSFEWLIYLLFPFLLQDFQALRSGRYGARCALRAVVYAALLVGAPILGVWLVIWLSGALARYRLMVAKNRVPPAFRLTKIALFGGLIGVGFVAARLRIGPDWLDDLWIGLATAGLCAQGQFEAWRPKPAFQGFMAGFSFSTYVIHYPVILFALGALQSRGVMTDRLVPGTTAMAIFFGTVGLAYVVALTFSTVTEAATPRFRNLLLALGAPMRRRRSA